MKSVKPGRGSSRLGVIGSICVFVFGLGWIIAALVIGAGPFALFGIPFLVLAGASVHYNWHNATSENRYSEYDIVDESEELDPLNLQFQKQSNNIKPPHDQASSSECVFCPFCGTKAKPNYKYCQHCGKRLP